MKRDAHFLYQDREGVFAFGSSFWSLRSHVFVFVGLRFCYNFGRRLFVCLIWRAPSCLSHTRAVLFTMKSSQKNMIRNDPFPVSCQKDSPWKVATDERTYLLESHLKFPGTNLLSVLVDTFSTKPKARISFHQTSHSTVLCHSVDRLFSRRRYDHPWAETKNRGKKITGRSHDAMTA